MLRRSALQALQALLHLAMVNPQWCSVSEIAEAQGLPAPMLEQLLLQLRRAAQYSRSLKEHLLPRHHDHGETHYPS